MPVVNDHQEVGPYFPSSPICQGVHQCQGDFAGAGGATKLSVTSILNPLLEDSKRQVNLTFGQQVEIHNC